MEKATEEIVRQPTNDIALANTKVTLDQGLKLWVPQQLITIADLSELGWKVITKYETNELEKAERSAKRKTAKKSSDETQNFQ